VFASVDSDREQNAKFLERYVVNVWPTFFVIDANSGQLLGMWEGAASVEELRRVITGALDAADALPGSALGAMLAGQRAHARGDYLHASRHYQRAVRLGGADWPRRSEAIYGWIRGEQRQRHFARCAQIGVEHVASIRGAAVPTDFVWLMMSCSQELRDASLTRRTASAARARLARHVEQPPASASVDDRSDALSLYASVLRRAGDPAAARRMRREQLRMLEAAAAKAPTPAMAATFDYARLGAYLALGEGEHAVRMLARRVEQLPGSYEPRARLAQALSALGRAREALEAIDGAVELAYGPRRLGYLDTRAGLLRKLAKTTQEREALASLIKAYAALPEKQRRRRRLKQLVRAARRRLARLGG
jgi:tetratricopeptide (TPR) repeat protein